MSTFQIRNSDLMNEAYSTVVEKRDRIREQIRIIQTYLDDMAMEVRDMKGVEEQLTDTIGVMERKAEARRAHVAASTYKDAYEGMVQ